jgi:hypothetical protein
MFIANSDETVVLPVQIKAVGPATNVSLGRDLTRLTTPWWIIVSDAYGEAPVCYVMTLEEVKAHAYVGKKDGSCWLQRKFFTQQEYEEAWDRLSSEAHTNEPQQDIGPDAAHSQDFLYGDDGLPA